MTLTWDYHKHSANAGNMALTTTLVTVLPRYPSHCHDLDCSLRDRSMQVYVCQTPSPDRAMALMLDTTTSRSTTTPISYASSPKHSFIHLRGLSRLPTSIASHNEQPKLHPQLLVPDAKPRLHNRRHHRPWPIRIRTRQEHRETLHSPCLRPHPQAHPAQ